MTYTSPVCKGDILIGSTCGKCEKCLDHIRRFTALRELVRGADTSPEELVITTLLEVRSLVEKLDSLALRVNYLADAVYGKQAVACAGLHNIHPSNSPLQNLQDFIVGQS